MITIDALCLVEEIAKLRTDSETAGGRSNALNHDELEGLIAKARAIVGFAGYEDLANVADLDRAVDAEKLA